MKSLAFSIFSLALQLAVGFPSPAFCDDGDQSDKLMGEINIESATAEKNSYSVVQDKTIEYFAQLKAHIEKLGQGLSSESLPELSDSMINHLTAVYLYCAVNLGECPMVLDGILEVDIINSKLAKTAQCPNMTKFWKLWVRNDMETRHKYMVKTGFLKVNADFNMNKRPAYIRCQPTVEQQISGTGSDADFFSKRYRQDSQYNLVAVKISKLLDDVKRQVQNVFVAVGAQAAAAPASSSAKDEQSHARKR